VRLPRPILSILCDNDEESSSPPLPLPTALEHLTLHDLQLPAAAFFSFPNLLSLTLLDNSFDEAGQSCPLSSVPALRALHTDVSHTFLDVLPQLDVLQVPYSSIKPALLSSPLVPSPLSSPLLQPSCRPSQLRLQAFFNTFS
jgi:hypothetical protein